MSDCEFCAIVAGEPPASVVHETDRAVAFLDLHTVTRGHTLVVPGIHARDLAALDPAEGGAMMRSAMRVAEACRESIERPAEGINRFLADGAVAGQEVFHAHLHVLPRFAGDRPVGQGVGGPPGARRGGGNAVRVYSSGTLSRLAGNHRRQVSWQSTAGGQSVCSRERGPSGPSER